MTKTKSNEVDIDPMLVALKDTATECEEALSVEFVTKYQCQTPFM